MSKKRLDESGIINELKGGSLFFQKQEESAAVHAAQKDPPGALVNPPASPETEGVKDSTSPARSEPRNETRVVSKESERRLDSTYASTLASYPDGLVDRIRKTVKSGGREVSFVRLTPEEKNQLVDIVYTYKRQGVKTSENEINRIAVNLLLADYEANGAASILARVIEALLA